MSSLDRFRQHPHNRARGAAAEARAVRWLEREGFEILETNFTTKAGEIDVIAREGEFLCFVEVKARATLRYGEAIEAVDERKRRRMARAAAIYLAHHGHDGPCRFDVLGMDPAPDGWRFTFVRNAFGLDY